MANIERILFKHGCQPRRISYLNYTVNSKHHKIILLVKDQLKYNLNEPNKL